MSIRQWIQENHQGGRQGQAWLDLWQVATSADFALSGARTDSERYVLLGTDDQLELSLRHLSAHIYLQRTKDYAGAQRIRAIAAPGSGIDVAPEWLISEATTFSKAEHQRSERVNNEWRRRKWNDKDNKGKKGDKDKGGGKGDQGKGGQQ